MIDRVAFRSQSSEVRRNSGWLRAALAVATASLGLFAGSSGADEREDRAVEMKRIAESFTVDRGEEPERQHVSLRPEPLLRWNDSTREFSDASLWAWGGPGRPAALLALELYPHSERGPDFIPSWGFELISLSTGPLEVNGGSANIRDAAKADLVPAGDIEWAPLKPGVTFQDIPDAPLPAATPTVRAAQMRDLVKRFSVKENTGREVVPLRLMPHPIDRYADPAAKLVDGSIFAFANGTNPEAIILIEAQGPSPEKAQWRFAATRVTAAAYEVKLDRREVWSESFPGGDQRNVNSTYFSLRLPRRKPQP